MRWEKDEWEIFAGAGPDITEPERRVVPLGVLLAADPSLVPLSTSRLDVVFGVMLRRSQSGTLGASRSSLSVSHT